jgi:hypothetical protein
MEREFSTATPVNNNYGKLAHFSVSCCWFPDAGEARPREAGMDNASFLSLTPALALFVYGEGHNAICRCGARTKIS